MNTFPIHHEADVRPGSLAVLRRGGTTLSEVLISILIMSIGIVTVATLFPVAILRSIQATQLTNATTMRRNAESFIDMSPRFLYGAPTWTNGGVYSNNDFIRPKSVIYSAKNNDIYFQATSGGTAGTIEPDWWAANPTLTDNGVTWSRVQIRNYVIDPLGWHTVDSALQGAFGNRGTATKYLHPTTGGVSLFRLNGNLSSDQAPSFTVLPDSYIEQLKTYEVDTASSTTTSVVFNSKIDAVSSTPVGSSIAPSRVVLLDSDGRVAEVREPITGFVDNGGGNYTVSWAASAPLPSSFPPSGTIGQVRVETKDRRYSYIISVRLRPTGTNCDVVVFFRRDFGVGSEFGYDASIRKWNLGADGEPGAATDDATQGWRIDDNQNGTDNEYLEAGYPGTDDFKNQAIFIQWDTGAGEPEPLLKKGSYACDLVNNRWYRILDVRDVTPAEETQFFPSTFTAKPERRALVIEGVIAEDNADTDNDGFPDLGAVAIPRGVVDVYPLRTRTFLETLN